jgi:molybdopterin-containing oxidoreductase family membrane subunit
MATVSATSDAPFGPLNRNSINRLLWAIWGILLLLGLFGVYQRFTQGHLPAGYGSYVPWGLWVALYFHGVGIAGGAFIIGAGAYILDLPGFRSRWALRATIVLSAAAIIPAFVGVWFDLGHMERSHYIFTSPAFTSMMAFNAWMYGVFMLCAVIAWLLSYRTQSGWLKPVLCLGVLFSVLFPSQSGAFFGVVDAKAHWHSALLPMVFLTSAITAGAATLLLVRAIITRPAVDANSAEAPAEHDAAIRTLRLITLAGLCVYFVLEFAEFSIALWNPVSHAPAVDLVLWGPYWWVFWIIHLAIGGLLALILLSTRNRAFWTLAAFIVAITFVSARLNVLIPGQAVGEIQGLQEAFQHDRLKYIYHATAMEYFVGMFLLAVGMAVFFVGQRISSILSDRASSQS